MTNELKINSSLVFKNYNFTKEKENFLDVPDFPTVPIYLDNGINIDRVFNHNPLSKISKTHLSNLKLILCDKDSNLLFTKEFDSKYAFNSQLSRFISEAVQFEKDLCHSKGMFLPRELGFPESYDIDYRECAFAIVNNQYKEGSTHAELLDSMIDLELNNKYDRPDLDEIHSTISIALGEIFYIDNNYVALIEGATIKNLSVKEILEIGNFENTLVYLEQASTGWLQQL